MDVYHRIQWQGGMIIVKEISSCIRNLPKHLITAIQSIWRNGVMSASSIFAVTITLLLIGLIGVVAINVQDMTTSVEESLTIYVQLESDASAEDVQQVGEEINKIGQIKSVVYSSKESELDKLIDAYGEDGQSLFGTYKGEENPLGDAYVVEVEDAQNLSQIAKQIMNIDHVNKTNYGGESTAELVKTLENVRNGGAIFIVALGIIALMLISNTIKVAITARQTEISIMRMVGASNWYIRIPFMIEGILIGLFGAVVPCLILMFGYTAMYNQMNGVFFSSLLSLRPASPFVYQFSLILAGLGSGVGLVGSYFSIRKFLKF